jgi:tetratricopeptide (TPR) repeat protein
MSRLSTLIVVLVVVGHLSLAENAGAQSVPTATPARLSLEDATRLTWRLDTRSSGITALRAIVAAAPDDMQARFELGRVLTWDPRTRVEGVTLLNGVLERQPARADVQEALAEVLSWRPATRAEATRLLRQIVEREPARTSARLKLAEVLSWDSTTRDESRTLYQAVLRDDRESVEAAVGLARLLSWGGRIAESRAWYELALARNPDAPAARVGIAELQGWNGRARASLNTLSARSGEPLDTPDALRVRAQAYSQIGRPARALDQYERLLTIDPGNTTALTASRTLRQGLRPSLEIGADLSTESGDPSSTKVETAAIPFRFAFHPQGRDTEIAVAWAQAAYRNSQGSKRDRLLGASVDAPLGNRVRLNGDVMSHSLAGAERTFTGKGQLQVAFHDGFDVRVGVGREQLLSSRLSLAGESVGGTFYGASFVNQAIVAIGARAHSWDGWAHATVGQIRGTNIADNARKELFAGAGKSFRPGGVTLRPGYSLGWMSYDLDLSGFPGAAAGDGVTGPGIGGYFSPARFLNHMARLDVTIPAGESVVIAGGAGIGRQRVEDAWARGTAPWSAASDAMVGIRAQLNERMSIGLQGTYQNVASAFDRTSVRFSVIYGF